MKYLIIGLIFIIFFTSCKDSYSLIEKHKISEIDGDISLFVDLGGGSTVK